MKEIRDGKLWAANLGDSEFEPREIYDFNDQQPQLLPLKMRVNGRVGVVSRDY
ncbi:hypothetical protein [Nostoc sp. 'Peltigera membranacea cyanobiont' 213]|uniref:hypothetical protein n=1 Tax=Nostoc sp. 'Peltigera membranacea cyanobiont' 213 TaxID=2014530 RepID=UPI00167D89C9|nr:hypothetical protein [Nostoc sp. 'Peltigera membranacea cyanobiont' 213]